jgi:hypothetical protein
MSLDDAENARLSVENITRCAHSGIGYKAPISFIATWMDILGRSRAASYLARTSPPPTLDFGPTWICRPII